MSFKEIVFEMKGGIATITMNRPQALNSFTLDTISEMRKALEVSEASTEVAVVLIKGAGERAFCAGADISLFKQFEDATEARRFWRFTGPQIHSYIESMTKPVVAVVSGYCLGGGLEIALSCDFIIASEDSKFGFPEINLGLIPGWGGTQRIARVTGRQKAKELVLLGEMINAREAYEIGLLNAVVPRDKLEQRVQELVSKLKEKSPIALAYGKDAVNKAYELDLSAGLSYETELDTSLIRTEDAREGVGAFLEKRKPRFKGK